MSTLAAAADVQLLIGLAVAVVFSIAITVFSPLRRSRYLCLLSLIGAAAYHRQVYAGFLIVNGIAYAAVCALNRQGSQARRWSWACAGVISLIVLFTLGRVYQWDLFMVPVGPIPLALFSLDMWLALRLGTLFWEVGSGALSAPSISDFLIWTCLPLTLRGPLLRYSQFPATIAADRSLWKSASWWTELGAGLLKLVIGMALPALPGVMSSHWPDAHLLNNITITFLTNPIGFYLSVAGYFSIMEALGRPSGFRLPMSFNFPIGRENISAFWMNWNMTATFVFRDYLFYNRWGLQAYNIYLNTIVLFTLVGLWHAPNGYWILWGFLHGVLFCGYLLWRKYGARFKSLPLRGTAASHIAARLFTYVCVCACWYLPSKILQKFGLAG